MSDLHIDADGNFPMVPEDVMRADFTRRVTEMVERLKVEMYRRYVFDFPTLPVYGCAFTREPRLGR